jgi:hypothetical protein
VLAEVKYCSRCGREIHDNRCVICEAREQAGREKRLAAMPMRDRLQILFAPTQKPNNTANE